MTANADDLALADELDAIATKTRGPAPDILDQTAAVAILHSAIAGLAADPGTVLTDVARQAWNIIYGIDPAEFERLRHAAKKAGARVAAIDRIVSLRRKPARRMFATQPLCSLQNPSPRAPFDAGGGGSTTGPRSKPHGDAANDVNNTDQDDPDVPDDACAPPGTPDEPDAPDLALRPQIFWTAANLPLCVSDAEKALIEAGEPIYQRGGTLVRPVRSEASTLGSVRRAAGTLTLIAVAQHHLVERMTMAADWLKFDARMNVWRPTCCPMDVAKTYIERAGYWNVPVLRAVVQHPIMTQSGRVISVGGYDPETRVLIDIEGTWPIQDAPTRDDAIAALARLKDLFRYFPWASTIDWAVAVSALLSALARPMLDTVPGHGFDAPESGTGKSLFVDAVAIAATGTDAPVMDWGHDPIEAGKRLDGMLIAGDAIIAIDNIDAPLEGAALCQTLTQTSRRIRPLGASVMTTVPMASMILATGNNLVLRGDITRRFLICRIDAKTDHPEHRVIDQDLKAECHARRRELVTDALTIMTAYSRAGRPAVNLCALGSFADWSRMVRDALVWCGVPDPVAAMETARRVDPARAALAAVLESWRAAFGRNGKTTAEAVNQAMFDRALRDALSLVAERKGVLSSSALGYWLRAHRDRRSRGLVLVGDTGSSGVVHWSVVSVAADGEADL